MINGSSKYRLVSIGIVAVDKVEDEVYIDVYPAEIQPVKDGEISEVEDKNDTIMDHEGSIEVIVNSKTTLLKAKWIPIGEPNRLGAPDVRKGEKVFLYQYGDLDEYYWMVFDNDLRLRKNEKKTIVLSNRPALAESEEDLEKAYYVTFDTINKLFRLHTDDSDGELTTYDIDLNTKAGILTIIDGNDNMIELQSEDGDYTLNFNRDMNVTLGRTLNETIGEDRNTDIKSNNTITIGGDETCDIGGDDTRTISGNQVIKLSKLSVTNDTAELVTTLSDFIQASSDEMHIGNLGIPTAVHPATKAVYAELKAKIDSFKI